MKSTEEVKIDAGIKPPIGLMPRKIHDAERAKDICECIIRHVNADMMDKIREEWIDELYDIFYLYSKTKSGDDDNEKYGMN